MCMGGSPKVPKPEPTPPPPAPPKEASKQQQAAGNEERRKALAAKGIGSTLLTSGLGAQGTAAVQRKTLLGQ